MLRVTILRTSSLIDVIQTQRLRTLSETTITVSGKEERTLKKVDVG